MSHVFNADQHPVAVKLERLLASNSDGLTELAMIYLVWPNVARFEAVFVLKKGNACEYGHALAKGEIKTSEAFCGTEVPRLKFGPVDEAELSFAFDGMSVIATTWGETGFESSIVVDAEEYLKEFEFPFSPSGARAFLQVAQHWDWNF